MNDFIPVWESVAPVRTVTFDLGEGRKLKGSVSGEIAIYFCDTDGKVFDILPALQSPAATLNAMKEAKRFYGAMKEEADNLFKRGNQTQTRNNAPKESPDEFREIVSYGIVKNYHKKRMKKVAAEKYDFLKKWDVGVLKDPVKYRAGLLFPESEKGEKIRDSYINSATDEATKDMRIMTDSKMAMTGLTSEGVFVDGAMTVVEPGGRGYYQWKIGQGFHDVWTKEFRKGVPYTLPITRGKKLMTPDQWKQPLFEDILKQELKGGEVEYNSDSLKAINLFEE